MIDDLDRRIIALLNKPDNRLPALAIARCSQYFKAKMLHRFWDDGEKVLRKSLVNSSLGKYWSLKRTKGESLIRLVPKNSRENQPRSVFFFFQYFTKKLFRFELCVQFEHWQHNYANLPEAAKLRETLRTSDMPEKHGWDGYRRITDDSKGIERTLEEEAKDGRYSESLFHDGWECFCKLEKPLRDLNRAIIRRK